MGKRIIKVFIASPGDLDDERKIFLKIVKRFNKGYGAGKNVKIKPMMHEELQPSYGVRPQNLINKMILECDLFIVLLHERWGQRTDNNTNFTSYTEEEYYFAKDLFAKNRKPQILTYFKYPKMEKLKVPDEQLTKVLDFKNDIVEENLTYYKSFYKTKEFGKLLDKYFREYTDGSVPYDIDEITFSTIVDTLHRKLLQHIEISYTLTNSELLDLTQAKELLDEDDIFGVRKILSEIIFSTSNLRLFFEVLKIFYEIKDYDSELIVLNKFLQSNHFDIDTQILIKARLAEVESLNDNPIRSGVMYREIVESYPELRDEEIIAGVLLNIGRYILLNYQNNHDLKMSEQHLLNALDKYTRLDNSTARAEIYSLLGLNYRYRNDFNGSLKMHENSYKINRDIDDKEGMAFNFGNIGLTKLTIAEIAIGDERELFIHDAIRLFNDSLKIFVSLDDVWNSAKQLGNLARAYTCIGHETQALYFYSQSNDKFLQSADYNGLAKNYMNHANLLIEIERTHSTQNKRNLNKIYNYLSASRDIFETYESKRDIAKAEGNLGCYFWLVNDLDAAKSHLERSMSLYIDLGDDRGYSKSKNSYDKIIREND